MSSSDETRARVHGVETGYVIRLPAVANGSPLYEGMQLRGVLLEYATVHSLRSLNARLRAGTFYGTIRRVRRMMQPTDTFEPLTPEERETYIIDSTSDHFKRDTATYRELHRLLCHLTIKKRVRGVPRWELVPDDDELPLDKP